MHTETTAVNHEEVIQLTTQSLPDLPSTDTTQPENISPQASGNTPSYRAADIIKLVYIGLSRSMLNALNEYCVEVMEECDFYLSDIDNHFKIHRIASTGDIEEVEAFFGDGNISMHVYLDEQDDERGQVYVRNATELINRAPADITEYIPEWKELNELYQDETKLKVWGVYGSFYFEMKQRLKYLNDLKLKREMREKFLAICQERDSN